MAQEMSSHLLGPFSLFFSVSSELLLLLLLHVIVIL